jgi:hypothetical protein
VCEREREREKFEYFKSRERITSRINGFLVMFAGSISLPNLNSSEINKSSESLKLFNVTMLFFITDALK